MGKLKQLKEKRASVFSQIDDLRKATDGRSMTAEEQQRWDTLMTEYNNADKAVEAEERFQQIQQRQAEQQVEDRGNTSDEQAAAEHRQAFADYLLNGVSGISAQNRAIIERRDGITGLAGGVIIPNTIANSIEVALKSYGGMFEAGEIITTANGGDLILPTINDTSSKATIVAEYDQSSKKEDSPLLQRPGSCHRCSRMLLWTMFFLEMWQHGMSTTSPASTSILRSRDSSTSSSVRISRKGLMKWMLRTTA